MAEQAAARRATRSKKRICGFDHLELVDDFVRTFKAKTCCRAGSVACFEETAASAVDLDIDLGTSTQQRFSSSVPYDKSGENCAFS